MSALVVSIAPTPDAPGSSRKARTSRYMSIRPASVSQAAPQANPLGRDRVTVDPEPVGALIEAQLDRAFRLATVILGNAMEAEDAVADTALAAWRARGGLREADRFEAWFGRILINVCRDRL